MHRSFWLAISFSERKPLQYLMEIAYRLRHLISLGTNRSAFPEKPLGRVWVGLEE